MPAVQERDRRGTGSQGRAGGRRLQDKEAADKPRRLGRDRRPGLGLQQGSEEDAGAVGLEGKWPCPARAGQPGSSGEAALGWLQVGEPSGHAEEPASRLSPAPPPAVPHWNRIRILVRGHLCVYNRIVVLFKRRYHDPFLLLFVFIRHFT